MKVIYSLLVLDILANNDGGNLTNNAIWSWDTGTRTTSAPLVQIVEPELTIDKNAVPTSVAVGDIITFTIDIAHSAQSSADAFDVVVADQIPSGLAFVTGSLNITGSATLTSSTYDPSTNIIRTRLGWVSRTHRNRPNYFSNDLCWPFPGGKFCDGGMDYFGNRSSWHTANSPAEVTIQYRFD